MNVSIARTLADANRHPEQVIRRRDEDSTHLVYLDEWQRFVALKIYRREFFADGSVIRMFLDRVEMVQARYAAGIAYPFLGGHENGRLYLLLQLLPGHHLLDLVQHRGPLDSPTLFALAEGIAERLEFVHRHYDLAPSLEPDEVSIHRDGPHEWTAGFSSYDLRPVRAREDCPRELRAIRDFTRLLQFLRTGKPCASFEALLEAISSEPALQPGTDPAGHLLRRLAMAEEEERPQTFPELRQAIEAAAPGTTPLPDLAQPPVSRSLLHWIPGPSALTDRFHYRQPVASLDFPSSFSAWDVLEDHPCRVHLLPPVRPERPHLHALLQQCVRLAHQNDVPEFTPVDAVMSDPSCCLISEVPADDLNLCEILKRREPLRLPEALHLIRQVAEVVEKLTGTGRLLPVLQLQNVLLRPARTGSTESWWKDLSEATDFQLFLRPFPTNLIFTEAPALSEIGGKGAARARATRNFFHPQFALVALAHRILRAAYPAVEDMPAPLAVVFHRAFSQSAPVPLSALAARLEKAARAAASGRSGTATQPAGSAALRRPALSFAKLLSSKTTQTALLAGALWVSSALPLLAAAL